MSAFEFVTSQPWAIEQAALQQIIEILEQREDIESLATRVGEPLRNTRTVENRDGVAVIPVTGPIFRYANLFTEISGGTSTQVLATDIQTALDDSAIRSLVLEVNSPGGRADGINELAQFIRESRGRKPVQAFVEGAGQSAAYWIASAADEVIVDRTALVGSIGVVMTLIKDTGKRDERLGVRRVEFVSSSAPNKRLDPESDEGAANIQALVDEMAEVFIEAVAVNRDVKADTVRNDFGQGGSLVGLSAVRAGMADRAGSLESVIAALAKPGNARLRSISMTSKRKGIEVSTTEELRSAFEEGYTADQITIAEPDLESIRAEAKAEGVKEGKEARKKDDKAGREAAAAEATEAERERIKGIQALAMPGLEKEVADAIDSGATVESASMTLLKAAKDRGVDLASIAADGTKVPHGQAPDPAPPDAGWDRVARKFGAASA